MTATPPIADRATWQEQIEALRVREKAHSREGDAIAAARRRLPMVEVDPTTPLVGPAGEIRLIDTFEGRTRDVTFAVFCEGPFPESDRYREFLGWEVPFYSVPETSRDALIAGRHFGMNVCHLRDGDRVFETYWTTGRRNETMGSSYAMLDLTAHGRQESWEDSPEGWPRRYPGTQSEQMRTDEHGRAVRRPGGRPISHWPRLAAGHSDDLGSTHVADRRQGE
jgi:predicted dithiol-disulfide oxidoreductase (DUF899 family)